MFYLDICFEETFFFLSTGHYPHRVFTSFGQHWQRISFRFPMPGIALKDQHDTRTAKIRSLLLHEAIPMTDPYVCHINGLIAILNTSLETMV